MGLSMISFVRGRIRVKKRFSGEEKLQCLEIMFGKVKLKEILMPDDVIRNKSLYVSLGLEKVNFPCFISSLERPILLSDIVTNDEISI